MGRKKSSKPSPKSAPDRKDDGRAKETGSRSPAFRYIASSVAVAVAVGGGITLKRIYADKPEEPKMNMAKSEEQSAAPYKRREVKPTMAPSSFSGVVASTYQIAREIPEVLDQIYCYCRCKENFGHLSLLSCYVDSHAAS